MQRMIVRVGLVSLHIIVVSLDQMIAAFSVATAIVALDYFSLFMKRISERVEGREVKTVVYGGWRMANTWKRFDVIHKSRNL